MALALRPFAVLCLAAGALSGPVSPPIFAINDPSVPHVGKHNARSEPLFERATCKDNLGRCFNPTGTKSSDIASRSAATAFCSSFLSIPVVTSILGTTTPVTTITVTATVEASTAIVTSVTTANVEATESVQTTVTSTTVVTPLVGKRAASSAPRPNCATGASYSPAQFSSACACISVTPSTTYVTATAPLATGTATATQSVTTTTVTVETSIITTGTATITVTSQAIKTEAPSCDNAPVPIVASNGKSFAKYCDKYYNGDQFAAFITSTYSACVETCALNPICLWAFWVRPTSIYGDKLYCYLQRDSFNSQYLTRALGGVDTFALNTV